jgi:carbamate kinase
MKKKQLYHIFVHLEKSFDRVSREVVALGISEELVMDRAGWRRVIASPTPK